MLGKKGVVGEKDPSVEEDLMADADSSFDSLAAQKSGLFGISGLFVRLSAKGLMDPDLAWSPTSPLDSKLFSNLGTITARSPRSPGLDDKPKSWDCSKIGLGLVDALSDDSLPSGSRKLLLESEFKVNLPSLISIGPFPQLGQQQLPKSSMNIDEYSLSMNEIAQSEDYTCIISHGPNPKTTHILGDFILDSKACIGTPDGGKKHWEVEPLEPLPFSPCSHGILSFCCSCNKKLKEGNDIYIYMGDKAFCSSECRESFIGEEMEDEENMFEPISR